MKPKKKNLIFLNNQNFFVRSTKLIFRDLPKQQKDPDCPNFWLRGQNLKKQAKKSILRYLLETFDF